MVRILGSPGRSRRLRVGVALAACTALVVVMAVPALAVHDLDFQLDGNIATSPDTTIGGTTQETDWQDLFDLNGDKILPLPAGFDEAGFDDDFVVNANGSFNSSDNTTFATGSKDTLPITPGWQCNQDNNVLSKSDVMNAYATSYVAPGGDEIMYFALERNANTGTGNVGFWFLQDATVACESPGGSTAFTGDHTDGDILVVSEFSQGGAVSTIQAYRWDGDANGTLNPDSVAEGAGCVGSTLDDDICAQVNTGTLTAIPWLTANKQDGVGHSLRVSEFYEGGINLTDLDLGGRCFNTFIGNTRSSTSLTATIFDFSLGQLGSCDSTLVTTPSAGSGGSVSIGTGSVSVTDSADLDVTGVNTWSGTLSFFLCGPIASGTCDTGGVPIGSAVAVNQGTSMPVVSEAATLTSAGRYCWRGFFDSATQGVPDATDSSTGECFTVTPVTPALDTEAVESPVDFGQPVRDNATLGGTATQPGTNGGFNGTYTTINATDLAPAGGKITFTLLKADCSTLATGTGSNPQDVTVSGNATYGPVSFTPDAPGTYHWKAQYIPAVGDSNNIGSTHNAACDDTDETVIVRTIPTEIKTRQSWFPNDTATIASTIGNLAGGGTVVFDLYDNATCTGTAFYHQSFDVTGGAVTETFTTTNTTVPITTLFTDPAGSTTGKYSWKVVYTPAAGDTAHTGKQSACDAEHFNITYTNDNGPGTDLP